MTVETRVRVLVVLLLVAVAVAAGLYVTGWFELDEKIEPSTCPVCEAVAPFKTRKGRKHAECPSCGAYERHRLLFHYLTHTEGLLAPGTRVLHFAANEGIEPQLRARDDLHYRTADLFAKADLKLDLTDIDQPDASWDLVICYHVLEHVDDDREAMREIFRVLAPGGRAILQVPLQHGREATYEDPSITDPKQRLAHFGQEDHVRLYGTADFRRRLEAAGFRVEALDYAATLPAETVRLHRMLGEPDDGPPADERIWIAHRP
jgi:SAM-dependent methyltransferase